MRGNLTVHHRNGWGATAVDGLSTAIVMSEGDIVNKILRQIAVTDFTVTKVDDQAISLFETTIRYLGGMISGMIYSSRWPSKPSLLSTNELTAAPGLSIRLAFRSFRAST